MTHPLKDQYFRKSLVLIGATGMFMGLLILLLGLFLVYPKANHLAEAVDQDLKFMEESLDALNQRSLSLQSSLSQDKPPSDLTTLLPETVISVNGTLIQSADALEIVGSTLDSLEKGITGLVLPKKQIGKNIASLQKISLQLRLLAGMMQQMEPGFQKLSLDATKSRLQLKEDLPKIRFFMEKLREQTRNIRTEIHEKRFGQISLAGCFVCSIFYFFFGLTFLTFSKIIEKIEDLSTQNRSTNNNSKNITA